MSDIEDIDRIILHYDAWLKETHQTSKTTRRVYASMIRSAARAGALNSAEQLEAHFATLAASTQPVFKTAWGKLVSFAKANNRRLSELPSGKRGPKALPKPKPSNTAIAAAVIYEAYHGKLSEIVQITLNMVWGSPEFLKHRNALVTEAVRELGQHFYPGTKPMPYAWLFPKEPNSDLRMSEADLKALVVSSGIKLSKLRQGYFFLHITVELVESGEKVALPIYKAEKRVAEGKARWLKEEESLSARAAYLAERAQLATSEEAKKRQAELDAAAALERRRVHERAEAQLREETAKVWGNKPWNPPAPLVIPPAAPLPVATTSSSAPDDFDVPFPTADLTPVPEPISEGEDE